jgi:hypothetical protein
MDFNKLYEPYEVEMLQDAYDTITRLDLWDWLRDFNPHPNEGFMFSTSIELATIRTSLRIGHSGTSFAWTMHTMRHIAKYGWEEHTKTMIEKRKECCPCRRAKGKLVGWCGVAGGGVPGCEH